MLSMGADRWEATDGAIKRSIKTGECIMRTLAVINPFLLNENIIMILHTSISLL